MFQNVTGMLCMDGDDAECTLKPAVEKALRVHCVQGYLCSTFCLSTYRAPPQKLSGSAPESYKVLKIDQNLHTNMEGFCKVSQKQFTVIKPQNWVICHKSYIPYICSITGQI